MRRHLTAATLRLSLLSLCLVLLAPPGHGQAGSLDPSFGTGGIVSTPSMVPIDVRGTAVQADGRIVVAGKEDSTGPNMRWILMRYLLDGSLDADFGIGGVLRPFPNTVGKAAAIAIDSEGRLVVTGELNTGTTLDCATVRLLADGSFDPTFGVGGLATLQFPRGGRRSSKHDRGDDIALAADGSGKIIVAARITKPQDYTDYLGVARYDASGNLDTDLATGFGELDGGSRAGFISDPSIITEFAGAQFRARLAPQTDGRLVVGAGWSRAGQPDAWIIARYLGEGSVDSGFGTGGKVEGLPGWFEHTFSDVGIQNGRILAVGRGTVALEEPYEVLVAGYHLNDGSVDLSFGLSGVARTGINVGHVALAVAIHGDGRFVVAGNASVVPGSEDLMIFRFLADGSADPAFGSGGVGQYGDAGGGELAWAVDIDPTSGNYVLAGWSVSAATGQPQAVVARYLGDNPTGPAAPSGLVAFPASSSQIDLSWTDNATDEDGFDLESSADGSGWSLLATLGPDTTWFSDSGLPANTTRFYRLRAFNTSGPSGWSNVTSATTLPDAPPQAPSGLVATALASDRIDLTWIDNASTEDGFEIDRSPDGVNWASHALLGDDVVAFGDTGLSPDTTWFYRVRAFNVVGNSTWSNTASATTPPLPAGVTVTTIDPNQMDAGTTIVATITGSGFAPLATVTFENGPGATPVASNVVVVGGSTITCDISVGTPGPKTRKWDVRVTNTDSSTGALVDGLTVRK